MHKNIVITGVVALIIGAGIGYAGAGMFSHPTTPGQQFTRGTGNGMMGGTRSMGGGFLTGTVSSKDAGSITLNTRDGSSHVVLITPNTTVSKSVNGALTDVTTGTTIIVSGTTNSDGSVSASLIQLRPSTSPQAQ